MLVADKVDSCTIGMGETSVWNKSVLPVEGGMGEVRWRLSRPELTGWRKWLAIRLGLARFTVTVGYVYMARDGNGP